MRRAWRPGCYVLAALLSCGLAIAAEPVGSEFAYTPPQAPPAPDAWNLLLRLFGMTLFVLLICAAVLWGIRFARRPRLLRFTHPGRLRSLDEVALWGRCSVHLLEAGGHRVLIAIDGGGMKALHLVEDSFDAALAEVVDVPREPEPEKPTVAEMMALLAASRAA